jgi:hypothetical protein
MRLLAELSLDTIREVAMQKRRAETRMEERIYQSLWHLLVAGVGIYEYRNQKTKLAKVLSVGLIAFHADGAIADLLDTKPLSQRIIDGVLRPNGKPKP